MSVCTSCGHENAEGAKFCSECGRALEPAPRKAREERKVVTVLFADLVGFTSRAERLDPEDVRALLSPYYSRLRSELERFGGTVEKFIGDAVMAVFGAPVAHEDDGERAVRAAIAIRDWVLDQQEQLQLRIGVNTGEALVSLEAHPSEGEGMVSGDVVNTAARLQTAAPVNGILVGESTYRATSGAIDYTPLDDIVAKGKTAPVRAWIAVEARARLGMDLARPTVPLVGRRDELEALVSSLGRVRRERTPFLLTIVGVPGIGKSRLVAELLRVVESDPTEFVRWRQGRCLPYGDGVTFWALAEMVKAEAGILESDSAAEAARKLEAAVQAAVEEEAEARWVLDQLAPLTGVTGAVGGGSRDQAFAAWRRFLEALAEQRPLVLVFEDLQWADTNLLDFIEHLIDWSTDVPVLVVCTARPELFGGRAGWAGGTRNASTLSLSPLSDDDTARLISSISERPVIAADVQELLLERAGGNPLYAEQYVRMHAERGHEVEFALPESLQGIIAARLDALSAAEKRLLQDAAVIGKLFWLGAVSAVSSVERHEAELLLHGLERKEFVQRVRRASVVGEVEYTFLHILVRDVAYAQIPRALRADRHRLAAAWIETLGRPEDHAEMLAHHYQNVVELLRLTGQPLDPAFAVRILECLGDAGDRAYALNAYGKAAGYYRAALELASTPSREHGRLLLRLGRAQYFGGEDSVDLLRKARDELVALADRESAADATLILAELVWHGGDHDATFEHLASARALVEDLPPSGAKLHAIAYQSRFLMLASQPRESIRAGRETLAMAERLGDDEYRAHALNNIGVSRIDIGDTDGFADLERSIAVAREAGAPRELVRATGNLAACLTVVGDLRRAEGLWQEAQEDVKRYGLVSWQRWFQGQAATYMLTAGRWDEAEATATAFIAEVDAGSPHYLAPQCLMERAVIRVARDDADGALNDVARALELSAAAKDPQNRLPVLAHAAFVRTECGQPALAAEPLGEYVEFLRSHHTLGFGVVYLQVLAWAAAAAGRAPELVEALAGRQGVWATAAVAYASGDLVTATAIMSDIGAVTQDSYDRLRLAQQLVEQGRRQEADAELERALTFYRGVRATRYIREGESLLAASA